MANLRANNLSGEQGQNAYRGAVQFNDADYLQIADSADIELGSNDYTVEFWAIFSKVTSSTDYEEIVNKGYPFQIYRNTSNDQVALAVDSNTSKIVKNEFQIAKDSNLEGVICPASDIANTTNLFDLIVTPGIRLENDLHGDQKNITTPKKAIELGAKYIVMGRSIKNNPAMVINELEV